MGEWVRRLSRTSAYINQLKIRMSGRVTPQTKMGRIDCPAIVQPDLLIALPNRRCTK